VLRATLISHSDSYYSTRRLLEAGQRLGYVMARVDPVRVVLRLTGTSPAILEDGVEHRVPDVVMPRIGATLESWSLALLEAWLVCGARSALSSTSIAHASDKVLTTLCLVAAGLPIVPTLAVREPFHVDSALDALPADAYVMKSRTGTGGLGVALAHGRTSARSTLGALTARRDTVLLQPFVPTRPTRDLRVLIAGMEPLATYWREAHGDEFRANTHRGGAARAALASELPAGALELALAAAQATNLPFCGVDLIEARDGLALLEVNASPGFQGAEEASGQDLATPVVQRWMAWPAPPHEAR
jgi:ribosomal protein S6--L-glutamate ligase